MYIHCCTDPCQILPLAQARPMMLCIYTSSYIKSANGIRTDLKCSKTHGSCTSACFCTRAKGAPQSCKSHPSTGTGVAYVTWRDVPILCPGILRILATALVSSDTQSYLRSSQNSDETYNNSSNIDWRRKVCICSNIWQIINTHALPSKGHLA